MVSKSQSSQRFKEKSVLLPPSLHWGNLNIGFTYAGIYICVPNNPTFTALEYLTSKVIPETNFKPVNMHPGV